MISRGLRFGAARERCRGRPEPKLCLHGVTCRWFVTLTYRMRAPADAELAYELMTAQDLLRHGQAHKVRPLAVRVAVKSPLTLYAWLLWALTFVPNHVGISLWNGLRSLYRAGTWKR